MRAQETTTRVIKKKKVRSFAARFIVLALVIGMNWYGLWAIGSTAAYYNDTETSADNGFIADFLDFSLSEYSFESAIALDEMVSKNTVLVNSGGMDFQYTLEAEEVADEDDFCGALDLQAKRNGVEQYDGDVMSLDTSASTTLGTWQFTIELPVDETSFTNGEECQFDIVFKGWQTTVGAYGDGGFSDEERMNFTITAGKMVVLNEFLPNPQGVAYGFDFGSDSDDMPQGEWVELYNTSDQSINLDGWYVWDASDGAGNKVYITADNTSPATTTISGSSWLVVYMNKAIFNNTGDTVKLFDNSNTLVDSHAYNVSDFCEAEPTPGDENSTDASAGTCLDVPPNKSYARIPDGIGDWVDPIPTPGGVNKLELEQEEQETENFAPASEPELAVEPVEEVALSELIADVLDAILPSQDGEASEEELLPTEESNEAPADTSDEPAGEEAVIPEEENATEPEAIEIPKPEPEGNTAAEPSQEGTTI